MMSTSKILRFVYSSLICAGIILAAGVFSNVSAQRDPFDKPAWAKPKSPAVPSAPKPAGDKSKSDPSAVKPVPQGPTPIAAPPIQQRIDYFKKMRELAVLNNQPVPKVTSVLTLDEMAVTGIFRTPRGYAAMVEAKPIKLSYTIYPGEKFFDGQLVAIEENKLVFRRVSKWSNGKFVTSEENKPLRQYTVEQEVNGTAPAETTAKSETPQPPVEKPEEKSAPVTTATTNASPSTAPSSGVVVSPLEEMLRQPVTVDKPKDTAKEKTEKKGKTASKKTVKVAENKKP